MSKEFECNKCGKCCRNLSKSQIYSDLDRGDGVCRFYNEKTHLCNIYEHRPIKCRIKESYVFFKEIYTYEEYLSLNSEGCKRIKEVL